MKRVRLYLDNLVVVYIVQRVGSIPTSHDRRICQEVGAVDPILEVKLEEDDEAMLFI